MECGWLYWSPLSIRTSYIPLCSPSRLCGPRGLHVPITSAVDFYRWKCRSWCPCTRATCDRVRMRNARERRAGRTGRHIIRESAGGGDAGGTRRREWSTINAYLRHPRHVVDDDVTVTVGPFPRRISREFIRPARGWRWIGIDVRLGLPVQARDLFYYAMIEIDDVCAR